MRILLSFLALMCTFGAAQAGTASELVAAARAQIGVTLVYDPSYQRIGYPNGDIAQSRGVCTDVVVRAYRKLGTDLQELVHRDMRHAWRTYPNPWRLKAPDSNIDHRRVPNLETFFKRHGVSLPPSKRAGDYRPGDIVSWRLPGNLPHIGIVSDLTSPLGVPVIIHNIGSGVRMEDMLFSYPISGHFRFEPKARSVTTGARHAPQPH